MKILELKTDLANPSHDRRVKTGNPIRRLLTLHEGAHFALVDDDGIGERALVPLFVDAPRIREESDGDLFRAIFAACGPVDFDALPLGEALHAVARAENADPLEALATLVDNEIVSLQDACDALRYAHGKEV